MITVLLSIGTHRELLSVEASGHAGSGFAGHDIVCSAVSALLRTTIVTVSQLQIETHATKRGLLSMKVIGCSENEIPRLQYAAEFLQSGLQLIEAEYPENIRVHITNNISGGSYGT